MIISFFIKMIFVLALCPVLLAAGVQTLTIDSQLGTSIEDCFERISIGQQLPSDAIYRNVTELTTRECEQICKQDKQCQSYDYGVGAKGNATCDLSNLDEKEIKDKSLLKRHPDYDLYVRRFQCEQSPPSPIQPQFDDPDSNPERPEGSHRPIFRPDDEKFSDDYLVSSDLSPYGPGRPSPYRPDDYSNPKPDYDGPPSYGSHRPQDVPYKPERPSLNQSYNSRPGDELHFQGYGPEKPSKPYGVDNPEHHYVVRPTRRPYQIQDGYKPRPDPYNPNEPALSSGYGLSNGHPSSPIGPPDRPYRPNRPYQKPSRPYERPGAQNAGGYGQNLQNDHSIYLEIYDPPRPYKPVDKPFGFQGYGTYSSQNPYNQNHGSGTITEINSYEHNRPVDDNRPDPIKRPQRPNSSNYGSEESGGYGIQKPQKPHDKPHGGAYGQGSYGGSHSGYGSSQGNYGNSQAGYDISQASHGSNQGSYQSSQSTHGSSQGSYGSSQSTYGSTQDNYGNQGGYGNDQSNNNPYQDGNNRPSGDSGYQRPQKPTALKPSHGSQNAYGSNQETYESNQSSYSSSQNHHNSNQAYGSQNEYYRPSNHPSDKPQKPQKPYEKPSNSGNAYGSSQGSYGSGQASYGSGQSSHGSIQSSYGSGQSTQDNSQASYGSAHSSHDISQSPYGSSQSSYGNNQGSYTSDKPSYGSNQASYGSGQGSYGSNQGSYGSNQGSYGSNQGSYGSNQGSYGSNQGSYGSNQGSDGTNQGSYGSNQGSYGSNQGSYGSNDSHYGSNQGSNGNNQGSYGSSQMSHGNSQGSYEGNQGSYGSNQGSYGSSQESYGGSQASYGNSQSYDSNRPHNADPYGNQNRPKPNYDSQNTGYNNKKPDSNQYGSESSGYEKPGYGKPVNSSDYPVYPGVKPVYESEMDRPGDVPSYLSRPGGDIVTSRPVVIGDYGDKPGYREPGKGATNEGWHDGGDCRWRYSLDGRHRFWTVVYLPSGAMQSFCQARIQKKN